MWSFSDTLFFAYMSFPIMDRDVEENEEDDNDHN